MHEKKCNCGKSSTMPKCDGKSHNIKPRNQGSGKKLNRKTIKI